MRGVAVKPLLERGPPRREIRIVHAVDRLRSEETSHVRIPRAVKGPADRSELDAGVAVLECSACPVVKLFLGREFRRRVAQRKHRACKALAGEYFVRFRSELHSLIFASRLFNATTQEERFDDP